MKNKFYVLLLLCFTGIFTATSQIPNYVPQNGLVGWWPFNSNAIDESGNGNNGTPVNSILTLDRFGNTNNAYSFDGNGDYIRIPHTNSLRLSGDFSISSWVRPTAINTFNTFLSKASNNQTSVAGWVWGYSNFSQPTKLHFQGSPFFNGISVSSVGDPLPLNTWKHLVVSYDSSVSLLKYFLDGSLIDTFFVAYDFTNSNLDLFIGNHFQNNDTTLFVPTNGDFTGDIDDIGMWNRALTQQEITNLYNGSTPPPCNPLPGNLMTGLVGYWPFCGNANDESGNGNNGTVNGASLTSDRFGNTNSAYEFDGIDDHIIVQDNQIFSVLGNASYTASAYVKFNSMPASAQNILGQGDGDGQYENKFFRLYGQNSQFSGHIRGNLSDPFDTRCNDSIVSPTTWHHIAMVRDYGNTLKLYIDGQLKSTQTDITGIANPYTNQRDIVMGAFFDANSNAYFNFLEGSLDDICIWNRALTNQEINQLTNQNICYQTITVTDTLLINVNLTGFNPVTYQNTIKVFPNPTNDHITIDFGTNYASLNGYSIRIDNTLGQSVFTSPVQQQAAYINLSSWTGVGVYFIYLLDSQNHVVDVRKIVLQ